MNGVNTKELCKLIKKSKRNLIWTVSEGRHSITNRHWLARFEEVPRDVLVTLFSIYAKLPQDGQAFVNSYYDDVFTEKKAINVDKIFESCEKEKEAEITPFYRNYEGFNLRVIKSKEAFVFVNNDFLKMIEPNLFPTASGSVQPVLFEPQQVIILPMRVTRTEGLQQIVDSFDLAE